MTSLTLAIAPTGTISLLADNMPEVNLCASTAIDPDAPCFSGPEGLRYRITARSGEAGRAVVVAAIDNLGKGAALRTIFEIAAALEVEARAAARMAPSSARLTHRQPIYWRAWRGRRRNEYDSTA